MFWFHEFFFSANTIPETEELRQLQPNNKTSQNLQNPVEKIFSSPPKWHNPCGAPQKNQNNDIMLPNMSKNDIFGLFNSANVEHPSDSDLMHGIISIAKVALRQSRFFKEDYVSTNFWIFLTKLVHFFSLIRNNKFLLDEMTHRNASKFAIF